MKSVIPCIHMGILDKLLLLSGGLAGGGGWGIGILSCFVLRKTPVPDKLKQYS